MVTYVEGVEDDEAAGRVGGREVDTRSVQGATPSYK